MNANIQASKKNLNLGSIGRSIWGIVVLLGKIYFFLLAAILLFLVWWFFHTRGPYGDTDSLKPDYFTIADKHFAIPRAHIWDRTAWGGGVQTGVNMHALLPDFKPYSQETKAEFDRLGHGKKIHFSIGQHRMPEKMFSHEQTRKWRFDVVKKSYIDGAPEPGPLGFTRQKLKSHLRNDLFYRTLRDGSLFFLTCSAPGSAPSPGCNGFIEYSEHIYVEYRYSLDFLKDWQAIDEGVYRLIRSFENAALESKPANARTGE